MNPVYPNATNVFHLQDGYDMPVTQKVFPPFKKEVAAEVKAMLEKHGCIVEKQGENNVVTFPEGTMEREIYPRIHHERHRITLPDGLRLMNEYDPYRDLNILFLLEDRK